MLEYERIHVLEGIDANKSPDKSKECDICHYRYFFDKNFNYEPYLCNNCHDMMIKAVSFNHVAVELVAGNSLFYDESTCHWQSQTFPRFLGDLISGRLKL